MMIDKEPLLKEMYRRGWTQRRLGIEANVNENTVSNFIQGKGVHCYTLEAIADALGYELVLRKKGLRDETRQI